jgi:hypothetical protein
MSISTTTASEARPAMLRRLAGLMLFIATTLGFASGLHLFGSVHGSPPFDADHAGIAEAVIGLALAAGAATMLRSPRSARAAGLVAVGFATIGFMVGLTFTSQGGHAPDIAYHVTILPVLLGILVILARRPAR